MEDWNVEHLGTGPSEGVKIRGCQYHLVSKIGPRRSPHGPPWARAANFVKKPPLIVNDTYLELNGLMRPCRSLEVH